ncbi:fimbria/pilus outer membrane usher protein [Sphingomonas solaris]|uniref:Fimbrial biogenesis outer membrane usher protein n=1 Tax=Alterirhizorhabdus solaris TaxID=2529389 RepID=A0A558QYW2_9SPHN|nr:fimbria/pilus outer membrane usher protein [Sphingomonas solaris]TVV72247.1 fimbrial biogenesis outer membrane usher protein [Sphingomonas solaris]
MRLSRLLSALPLVLASAPAVALPDAPALASVTTAPAALFVELVVNAQANGALAAVTQEGDRLWIEASALREAGIAVTGNQRIDVAARSDFHATYDAPGQRLLLDVPTALLPTRRIAADPRDHAQTIVDTGALLNYDLYVQHGDGRTAASLWTEQRAFGGFGTLSNTGLFRAGALGRNGYVRLDTRYRFVDERRALTVTAGDLITQALPWTTAVRVGGVQIARSFRVRPDLVTVPLPSFAGQATVPSGVDLFVNGYRQQRAEVAPGRFVLDNVPVVNGAGEARIVTTDAVGRQVATVVPFYVASELLRPGLTDFSVEAGALRRGYGITSLDYGRFVASASLRHGMSKTLTVEAHAEAAAGLAAGGGGVVWAPGLWGALHGTVSASRRGTTTGTQITAGYNYTGRRFSMGVEHIRRSGGFADVGSFDLRNWRGGMRADRASASINLASFGSIGLGYIDSRTRDNSRVRLASASLSMPVGARMSLFAAADYDVDRRGASAQLRLSVPFGRGGIAGAGISRQPGGDLRVQANVARSVPVDGGLGISADAAIDRRGTTYGQTTVTWRGPHQQVDAGTAWAGGSRSTWGGVSGSVAFLDHQLVAANALPDAFAVVATGAPRVAVYYENQRIGTTGRSGRLFVPRVTAYHPGRFAIDAVDLPIGMQAKASEARVALREGAGAVIRMPVTITSSITVRLFDRAGAALPPGTAVALPGGGATVVGWDGIVLLEGMTGPVELAAIAPAGPCRAHVTIPRGGVLLADLGVVRCE